MLAAALNLPVVSLTQQSVICSSKLGYLEQCWSVWDCYYHDFAWEVGQLRLTHHTLVSYTKYNEEEQQSIIFVLKLPWWKATYVSKLLVWRSYDHKSMHEIMQLKGSHLFYNSSLTCCSYKNERKLSEL